MGLDMYLSARKYVSRISDGELSAKLDAMDFGQGSMEVKYIECEAMYWRKANHIHKWFVDNVQGGNDDCGRYDVSHEDLQTLAALCRRVVAESILVEGPVYVGTQWTKEGGEKKMYEHGLVVSNPELAEELLPCGDGFFFGSTEYNQFYIEVTRETAERLEELLKLSDEWDFTYHASW